MTITDDSTQLPPAPAEVMPVPPPDELGMSERGVLIAQAMLDSIPHSGWFQKSEINTNTLPKPNTLTSGLKSVVEILEAHGLLEQVGGKNYRYYRFIGSWATDKEYEGPESPPERLQRPASTAEDREARKELDGLNGVATARIQELTAAHKHGQVTSAGGYEWYSLPTLMIGREPAVFQAFLIHETKPRRYIEWDVMEGTHLVDIGSRSHICATEMAAGEAPNSAIMIRRVFVEFEVLP